MNDKNEKELAIREQESSFVIQAADLSKNDLPSLEDAQELPFAVTIGLRRNRVNLEKCTL